MLVDHYRSGDHAGNAQGVSDQGQCGENPATCYRLLAPCLVGWSKTAGLDMWQVVKSHPWKVGIQSIVAHPVSIIIPPFANWNHYGSCGKTNDTKRFSHWYSLKGRTVFLQKHAETCLAINKEIISPSQCKSLHVIESLRYGTYERMQEGETTHVTSRRSVSTYSFIICSLSTPEGSPSFISWIVTPCLHPLVIYHEPNHQPRIIDN